MITSNAVVINKDTRDFVPYRLGKNGEIVIVSTDPNDTDATCIVTTWENITKKNEEMKKFNVKTTY